ncbi:MAG: LysM peptidoglycan-binding domain-containing protein [bacterium]|nr:LysM peptidoglycan-binding domain-containing protein [bacterium]
MPRHTIIPSRVLIVISTVVVALVLLLASSVQATPELLETSDYKVRAGDNLWEIADDVTPEGRDVRNTIEAIKRLNDLDSSVIHPGQLLEVPVSIQR